MKESNDRDTEDFESEAQRKQTGFGKEFWLFLRNNKKWWLTPVVVILLGVGLLVMLGTSGAAPFIYTLF